jgi:hypothetical protein
VVALASRPAFTEVLSEDAYRRLWLSGLCLNTARWMDLVVLGWLALQLTGSPFMVGLAAFARSAPDDGARPVRRRRRGPAPSRARAPVHPGAGPSHGARARRPLRVRPRVVLALVALEVLFGALWALDFPRGGRRLYSLVGSSRVATAVSLETVSMQLAKMVGPVLAGVGLAHFSPAACFGAMAACYALGLAVSVKLRSRHQRPRALSRGVRDGEPGRGFRAAWEEPTVRAVLVITVLINVLLFPYQHMLVVFARDVLSAGPDGWARSWPRGAGLARGRARHRVAPRLHPAPAHLRRRRHRRRRCS